MDFVLTRTQYMLETYHLNDYLFHIGNYDFHIISAIPEKTTDFSTMLKPFDVYIWLFIGISTIAIMLTMMAIEMTFCAYMEKNARTSIHQCKCANGSYFW